MSSKTHGASEIVLLDLVEVARVTRRRLRVAVGLRLLAKTAPWSVLFLVPFALLYRLGTISGHVVGWVAGLVLAGNAAVALRAALAGPGLLEASLQLDTTHGLRGRLSAALGYHGAFAPQGAISPDDSGYVALVMEQAAGLGSLSAARAVPLVVPPGVYVGAILAAFWCGSFLVPRLSPDPGNAVALRVAPPKASGWLDADDAQLLARAAQKLQEGATSDAGKVASEKFDEIVRKASSGEIDQTEAFRLAAQLRAEVDAAGKESTDFSAGLAHRGAALEKSPLTRALGSALAQQRYADAARALEKLAQRLSQEGQALSQRELSELRTSLEQMRGEVELQAKEAAENEKRLADEEGRQKEREQQLLKKKADGAATPEDQRELEEIGRRLKTLSREKKQAGSAQQTLSELDRSLAEAARELQREQKKAGGFLEQAARSLSTGAQKQLTDDEKREMIKQLEAMKERLRRQNQEGNQAERLREFQKRARGEQGEDSEGGKPGAAPGEGSPGQMRMSPVGVPVPGRTPGDGQGQSEAEGDGKEPGKGHQPGLSGDAARLPGASTVDTTAVAQDTGQGESASETIRSVAEAGFSSASYEKLFREYETVAEDVMEKDEVPVGKKAHVLRYFELIRPRERGDSRRETK